MEELLREILKELKEQAQAGFVYGLTPFPVDMGFTPITRTFDPPLFSIKIENDGPGIVEYRIPNTGPAQWITLRPGEEDNHNFIKGVITGMAVRDPSNGVFQPVVRITGTY